MKLAVAFIALLSPLLANAWSIMFYSGDKCNQDDVFVNIEYSGLITSGCVDVGWPGGSNDAVDDHCIWHLNNGAYSQNCTDNEMIPPPSSWMFSNWEEDNVMCWVGWNADCAGAWLPGDLPKYDTCYTIADWHSSHQTDHPMTFECKINN